jgi:hypothetical protein
VTNTTNPNNTNTSNVPQPPQNTKRISKLKPQKKNPPTTYIATMTLKNINTTTFTPSTL